MPKMMSILEKLNLVEKVNDYKPKNETNEIKETPIITTNPTPTIENTVVKISEIEKSTTATDKQITHDAYSTFPKNRNQTPEKVSYDKYLSIDDIYAQFNLEIGKINTVFMLNGFINALPKNLPHDIKKKSVLDIVAASNSDLNKLISDGEERLNVINKFMDDFSENTSNSINLYKIEIKKLSETIKKYNDDIKIKETMISEQKNVITYETERIHNIIDFFESTD